MRFLIKLNVYINQITSPLHLCLKRIKISLSFFSDGGQHACLLSYAQVQIPLKRTIFSVKFVFEKNENKQKEAGVGTLVLP